ncbi:MAG: hypothetical protein KAX78_03490, partial [Phycisphaerae bacterium]|nr:hypothetical protein [Phycisphaerae bacterium]
MSASIRSHSRTETAVSVAILIGLVAIAAGVIRRGVFYDPTASPADLTFSPIAGEPSGLASDPTGLAQYLGDGVRPWGQGERFGPDDVFQKINGRAELYFAAGFISLQCQRFQLAADEGDSDRWAEAFVYEMASHRAAFSVYSTQRRSGVENVELGDFAYRTANGLYFVHGPFYVELVSSVITGEAAPAMLTFGRNFIALNPATRESIAELQMFAPDGLDPDSVLLLINDAFGLGRLDNVFTARYAIGGVQVTAFLSQRATQQEAAELAKVYFDSLMGLGGEEEPADSDMANLKVVKIMDGYEFIFSHGRFFAGV